jgi:hypothetical protein
VAFVVCWVMVLIKMFKESILMGILGLLCTLWAFIWGWINAGKNKQQKIMIIWTVAMLISGFANTAMIMSQLNA